jgi:predicted transcriptional regulator
MPARSYKDSKIYMYIALRRVFSVFQIELHQPNLENLVDRLLADTSYRVTKEDIKHEIMSNHFMTNKVLDSLLAEGFIVVEKLGKEYNIRITKKGVMHLCEFDRFYREIYKEQLKMHYAYRKGGWVDLE